MRLTHASRLVCSASNRGVLIDVVTRWGVSCRLRNFFKPRLWGWAQFRVMTAAWQFLAPLLLSPRQVKSPSLLLLHLFLPLSRRLQPRVSHPVSLRHVSWESRPSSPALTALRQCQSLPLSWRQMQRLRFNGSYFSTCSLRATFTLSVLLYKQKTVIRLQCHSFSSTSHTWALMPPQTEYILVFTSCLTSSALFTHKLLWNVILSPAYSE